MSQKSTASDTKSGKNKVYISNARDARKQSAGSRGGSGTSTRSGNGTSTRSSSAGSRGSSGSPSRSGNGASTRSGSGSPSRSSGSGSTSTQRTGRTSRQSTGTTSRSTGRTSGKSAGSVSSKNSTRATQNKSAASEETLKLTLDKDDNLRDEIGLILTLLVCILIFLSSIRMCGSFGDVINTVIFGLFGYFGYAFPFVTFLVVLFAVSNKRNATILSKIIFCILMMIDISALVQLVGGGFDSGLKLSSYFSNSLLTYTGPDKTYGGFLGGVLCKLICPYLGKTASIIVFIGLFLVLLVLLLGKAIFTAITRKTGEGLSAYHRKAKARREEDRLLREEEEFERREILAQRRRRVVDAYHEFNDQAPGSSDYDEEYRKIIHESYDDDDLIDELIKISDRSATAELLTEPIPRERFTDTLLKKGRGLDMSRVKDTPEYQEIKNRHGMTDYEMSELIAGAAAEKDAANSKNAEAFDTDADDTDDSVDLVSRELRRKFGEDKSPDNNEKTGIQIINLRPRSAKQTEQDRNLFIDEDPDEHAAEHDTGKTGSAANTAGSAANTAGSAADTARTDAALSVPDADSSDMITGTEEEISSVISQDEKPDNAPAGSVKKEKSPEKKTSAPERTSSNSASFNSPEEIAAAMTAAEEGFKTREYEFPPIDLLNKSEKSKGVDQTELDETVKKLQAAFESFGVRVRVGGATCGPTVTRYELYPEQGVKVKTITSLTDDIKLALAVPDIRVEAPIPGKSAVGIEVPNKVTTPVSLRDLIDSPEFKDAKSTLTFAVGKDIAGKTICFDIASMPHMLVAGATGSGKSVCINSLILSIMYKAKPSDVRMIMVDPKRVELVGYNGIPHLLVPVVTDVKKASGALNWAIAEMDDRYQRFADAGVNNLKSFNHKVEQEYYENGGEGECPDRLPQILIIIDELNDLMMTANSKEVEASIARLTQLARACGIHVVLATQRPSVNVITGTIKANIPSRIAFAVSSFVDSKTILDQGGADKLLGKGDMLFYPQGYPQPVRLQGAFVSDNEIASVVKFIKDQCEEVKYNEHVAAHIENNAAAEPAKGGAASSAAPGSSDRDNDRDELFEEAGRSIIEKKKASVGMLQRQYRIGFNRAARIMDQLADEGVVGPEEGTKPRRILMTLEQFNAHLSGEDIPEDDLSDDDPSDDAPADENENGTDTEGI